MKEKTSKLRNWNVKMENVHIIKRLFGRYFIIKGFLYFFTNTCTLHIIQDQTIPKKIHHDKHFILS